MRVEDDSEAEECAPALDVRQEVLHALAQLQRLAIDLFRVTLASLRQLVGSLDQLIRVRDRVLSTKAPNFSKFTIGLYRISLIRGP